MEFKNKIKIFSDGADKQAFLDLNQNKMVKGFTTNPSLMKKAGVKDYKTYSLDILKEITEKPISFEVFADNLDDMKRQAMDIKTWGQNVYVKIPITNSKGETCVPLIDELSKSGIKLNVTAIFTLEQVQQTVSALKGGSPSIVSIFAGRIADTGRDPVPMMMEAKSMCEEDPNIELLWASTRELFNIVQAEHAGCHIITVAPDMIKKLHLFGKSLKEYSLETVNDFLRDSTTAGFKL